MVKLHWLCVKQYQQALSESGELIKPISLYVRGDVKQLVDMAYKHGLLLFKVTDYKSLVKYHGEYIVYPANNDLNCLNYQLSSFGIFLLLV